MSVRASARVARGARLLDAGRLDERRGPDPARTRSRFHAALRRARGSAPRLNHPDPAPPGRADFSRTTAILRRTSPRSAMNSGTSRGMRPKPCTVHETGQLHSPSPTTSSSGRRTLCLPTFSGSSLAACARRLRLLRRLWLELPPWRLCSRRRRGFCRAAGVAERHRCWRLSLRRRCGRGRRVRSKDVFVAARGVLRARHDGLLSN